MIMQGAELGAGGFFELGPVSLRALADLKVSFDTALAAITKAEKDYQAFGPVFHELHTSNLVDSGSDPCYLELGGPTQGRAWEVRALIIGGLTWATTVAGTGGVFVLPTSPSTLTGIGLASIRDMATSLPSVAFYSAGQLRVRHPNRLSVVIIGGTASTPYVVAGMALDVPDQPARGVVSL